MNKRNKSHLPDMFSLALILLTAVLVSCYLTSGLYARYITTATAAESARVAKFDVSFVNPMSQAIDVSMNPQSAPEVLRVDVINNSDAAVRVFVKAEKDGNLPLIINGFTPLTQSTTDSSVWYYDSVPGDGYVSLNLSVEWDSSNKSYIYSGGIEHLTMTVYTEQID